MRDMKISVFVTIFCAAAFLAASSFAQQTSTSPAPGGKSSNSGQVPVPANPATGQPSAADMEKMMQQMMELSKLNENHKLLGDLAGTWSYTVKMWMNPDPSAKPEEYKGTAVRKP